MDLAARIRSIRDFPKKGIVFRDITTLLKDQEAFREAVNAMAEPYRAGPPDLIVAVEARGFIFAGAMAYTLRCGFAPVRKPGKLPSRTASRKYELEYRQDEVQIHLDAIAAGDRVLIVDDLLATGGTAAATAGLVQSLGGRVIGLAFLIELDFLNGRGRLKGYDVRSLIHYESE